MVTEDDLLDIEEQAALADGTYEGRLWEAARQLAAELYLSQERIKKLEKRLGAGSNEKFGRS